MFQSLIFKIAMGALRHGLTALGGALVTDGILTSDQSNWAIGAIIALAGLAWSGLEKWQAQKATGTTGAVVRDVPVEVKDLPPVQ